MRRNCYAYIFNVLYRCIVKRAITDATCAETALLVEIPYADTQKTAVPSDSSLAFGKGRLQPQLDGLLRIFHGTGPTV